MSEHEGQCPYCPARYSTALEVQRHLERAWSHYPERLAAAEAHLAASRAALSRARGLIVANRLMLGEHETPRHVAEVVASIDAALAPPSGARRAAGGWGEGGGVMLRILREGMACVWGLCNGIYRGGRCTRCGTTDPYRNDR